ncbi:MAG TPA: hypothetical protein P5081_01090 [Phycisphaerae bacterium]|nr:hypothetical protein [Phycisphaerae bacterium]HRW51448.1 hypothetical protein [Phycisphaerae bacterium]
MAIRETRRVNPAGIRLRRDFEQEALKRMLRQLDDEKAPVEPLCRLVHAYCELLRQDAALEKSQPTKSERRPDEKRRPSDANTMAPARRVEAARADLVRTVRDLYGVAPPSERAGESARRLGATTEDSRSQSPQI